MDETQFDPRIPPRRPWREALAAIASCAVVVAGGYAVGAAKGPDAVSAAEAEAAAPVQEFQFAAAGDYILPSIPATLTRPAQSAYAEAAEPAALDYTQLSDQTLGRVSGISVEQFTIRSGDTLGRLLTQAGVTTDQSAAAISALKDIWDPRHLKVGQEVTLYLYTSPLRRVATRDEAPDLVGLTLKPDVDRTVGVALDTDGEYQAREVLMELQRELVRVSGDIDTALWVDMTEAGATDRIVGNFANLFSYSVDIQRQIQPGDDFEIMYEQFRTPGGELVKTGDILYAALETNGVLKQLYRFEAAEGADYFDAEGVSIRRFLMKTPINGARLSSRFGMRRHPIQGYNRLHKGTDFAAPRGTPIYAAGDGVVEKAYRSPSYGNYILIKHSGTWQTAYAHMHNFASGMREGRRVQQGEVIGYVGSTGNSTGPHLHYEVLQNGQAVDSMSVQVPTGKELDGDELSRYMAAIGVTRTQYAEAPTALDAETAAVAQPTQTAAR
jgi:murein DD-endopeptidase MepM/ murein hydrolase activator NlpD